MSADLAGVEEGGPVLVWPHPRGDRRGIALAPLHSVIPDLAFGDEFLYAIFAVLDALRSGDARLRELARSKLTRQLTGETL